MMIFLQLFLFLLLFTGMVAASVRGGALEGLFFYPKPFREKAIQRGLATDTTIKKKEKRFKLPFCAAMLLALLLIVGLWSGVSDFWTAYGQALLFLEVMNWYDGIVIDRLWVGHSRFWVIAGMEDTPYAQTWRQILIKRSILTLLYATSAFIVALLIVVIF